MNILIVKLSSIGDVIHTLPALAELRRHFSAAHITWIVERSCAQLLRENPLLDQVIEIDTQAWRRRWRSVETWQEVFSIVKKLRSHQFDVGFDFQGLLKSGLVLFLSGARRRIGFGTAYLREKPSLIFLTQQVDVPEPVHVIEKNLQLITALGAQRSGPYEFPMSLSEDDRLFVDAKLRALGIEEFAIVNPGGNWKGKQWSPEGYAAVCDFVRQEHGLTALVTFAPNEERLAGDVVSGTQSSAHPFPCTLKQLAALADRASLFVGGDTGPLHLAAARGTPIVAIFGATLAYRNGPFSLEDVVVQDPFAVPEAYYRRLNDDQYIKVSINEVLEAVERRLTRASKTRSHHFARTAVDGAR